MVQWKKKAFNSNLSIFPHVVLTYVSEIACEVIIDARGQAKYSLWSCNVIIGKYLPAVEANYLYSFFTEKLEHWVGSMNLIFSGKW